MKGYVITKKHDINGDYVELYHFRRILGEFTTRKEAIAYLAMMLKKARNAAKSS